MGEQYGGAARVVGSEGATDEEVRGLPSDLPDRLDPWPSNMVERLG
jgi:hypothetical protein